jgi:hypothetical protein
MRVLLENNIGQILLIAFTNHALDHLLHSILNADITQKIARLGSRSSDEQISRYSIEELAETQPSESIDRGGLNRAFKAMRYSEEELKTVLKELQGDLVSEEDLKIYIEMHQPEHHEELNYPPHWIRLLKEREQGWTKASKNGSNPTATSYYQSWTSGEDIQWLKARRNIQENSIHGLNNRFAELNLEEVWSDDESLDSWGEMSDLSAIEEDSTTESDASGDNEAKAFRQFIKQSGLSRLPDIPSSDRALDDLLVDPFVWNMSMAERERLARSWVHTTRQYFFEKKKSSFSHLKEKYEAAKQEYDDWDAEVCCSILRYF